MLRLTSLALFFATWLIGAALAGQEMLPGPVAVVEAIVGEARSGALFIHLGATLGRVLLAFALAMTLGTALGILMGRVRTADRLGDPWLVILLNLPALVVVVLAYIWGGLTETAAIAAVAVNKLPNAIVTVREGARALDPTLDEMAGISSRGAAAAPALSGGGVALRPVAGVEDRAGRRAAGPAERRRVRDRYCVPAVRCDTNPRLCAELHRRRAGDRNLPGATP
jgi:ABC-type proline/glycine betaine transport system permease subunit